jgi:hypothetical protein
LSLERVVSGIAIVPFARQESANDPYHAIARVLGWVRDEIGADAAHVVDIRQRPAGGGAEWECSACGYRNLCVRLYPDDVCNSCERPRGDQAPEEEPGTTAEYLAELVGRLRTLPAESGITADDVRRLTALGLLFQGVDA